MLVASAELADPCKTFLSCNTIVDYHNLVAANNNFSRSIDLQKVWQALPLSVEHSRLQKTSMGQHRQAVQALAGMTSAFVRHAFNGKPHWEMRTGSIGQRWLTVDAEQRHDGSVPVRLPNGILSQGGCCLNTPAPLVIAAVGLQ